MLQAAISSYLLGSIPTAYLLGRWRGKLDIRRCGFQNMGTLNVFKMLGPFWGVVTLLLDAGKGAAAVLLARANGLGEMAVLYCGIMVVAGHNWPVFLGFKGGKGAATGLGVILVSQWNDALLILGLLSGGFLLARNITFALGLTFAGMPALNAVLGRPRELAFSVVLLGMITLKMRPSWCKLVAATGGRWRLMVKYAVFGIPKELSEQVSKE